MSNRILPSAHLWQQEQEEQKMSSGFRPYRAAARHLEMGFFKKYCDAGGGKGGREGGIGRLDGMAKGRRERRGGPTSVLNMEGCKGIGRRVDLSPFVPISLFFGFVFSYWVLRPPRPGEIYDPQENGKAIAIRVFSPLGGPPYSISPPPQKKKFCLSERESRRPLLCCCCANFIIWTGRGGMLGIPAGGEDDPCKWREGGKDKLVVELVRERRTVMPTPALPFKQEQTLFKDLRH